MNEIATWEPQGICEASGFKYPLSQLVRQSGDVLPVFAGDNAPDGVPCDLWKARRNLSQRQTVCGHLSNVHHIFLLKDGHVAFLTSDNRGDVAAPSLSHPVGHVVSLGSCRKMPWVHARRIVARVHNAESFNRAVMHFMRNSVCQKGFVVVGDDSVAFRVLGSAPRPTIIRAIFDSFCVKVARYGAEWLNPPLLEEIKAAVLTCLSPLFHLLTMERQEIEVNA